MRMNTKKRLAMLGAFCAVTTLSLAISSLNSQAAKADTVTPTASEFYMEEGAAVRTDSDKLGIRFSATITKDYWEDLQEVYGANATYSFYSIVTDDTEPIRKDYGTLAPDFTESDMYTFYSTIVYTTEELESEGLLDEACELELSAQTYVDVTKAGEAEPTTIAAYGQTGSRSMKAVANAAVLAGETGEDLAKYFTVGNRSEAVEGYSFTDKSGGVVTMAALPDLSEATDMEVYYGAEKVNATYENGKVSFESIPFDAENPYVSVFTGGKVYSAKVTEALKITQSNVEDLLSLTGNEMVYLAEDIDLTGKDWTTTVHFTGMFDGGNHAVKNLTTTSNAGFFQLLSGTVKNVAFTNVTLVAGTGAVCYQTRGKTLVENVFIQVAKTNNSGSNRFGAICERANGDAHAVNLTDVVIKMPGTATNESIYGYALKGTSVLTNVHCIGLPNENASVANSGAYYSGTYTLHTSLDAFNAATKTLTPFLESCVTEYLNNAQ